ncbi:MAG: AraC family transcriptional regulator [Clostridiales bacterium]|nr:AraC family transcriptional regulator [Clostridiales bacterium]
MIFQDCDIKTNSNGEELAVHGTALLPAACYETNLASKPVSWHWHDEFEAVIILEGTVSLSVGATQVEASAGSGFFINSGMLHSACVIGENGCRLRSIVFHPRLTGGSIDSIFWQKYLLSIIENPSLDVLVLSDDQTWGTDAVKCIAEAWNAAEAEAFGYEFVMRDLLSRMILDIFPHIPPYRSVLSDKTIRNNERMKQMLKYMQEHFSEELTLDEIAQSASISKSECIRCFKNIVKTTPIQYLKQYRIQRAAELLASTDLKILQIGTVCGFQEMSYFARTFREFQHCTPLQYRLKHKKTALQEEHIKTSSISTVP